MDIIEMLKGATVLPLGVEVTSEIPLGKGHPVPQIRPLISHGDQSLSDFWPTTVANEVTSCTQHTGTHIDALCHIGYKDGDRVFIHGGFDSREVQGPFGFKQGDVTELAPFVGRAVLLDVARALHVDVLPDSYAITAATLSEILNTQRIVINDGDAALIRTGFMKYWTTDQDRFSNRGAGITLSAARLLIEKYHVSLIGSDTQSVEVIPSRELEVHRYALFEQGVPLLENLALDDLSARYVTDFGLIVAPLRLVGATASMINPLGILKS